MGRRAGAILLVSLLFASVVTIQIADPQMGEQTPPEVDFSETPEEVVADAATQFEYVDYSYRLDFKRNESADWRELRTMRVDHSDREYLKTGLYGEDGVLIYGTDAITFVRPGSGAAWRVTAVPEVLYHSSVIGQPFRTDRILGSNGTIIYQNQSTLTVRIPVHSINVAEHLPGHSTITIDKKSGLIKSARISYKSGDSNTRQIRFRLSQTGVDVRRPEDIPLSPQEYFWDLLRGPIIDIA